MRHGLATVAGVLSDVHHREREEHEACQGKEKGSRGQGTEDSSAGSPSPLSSPTQERGGMDGP